MVAAAEQLCGRYREITCPTLIMAGDADRIVDVERQPKRLHGAIPGSRIDIFSGAGHMLHHVAPERVVRGIEYIANGGITTATMKAERATWGT
jgi:pimeloyl-ACP methyl ester carboxylesterase